VPGLAAFSAVFTENAARLRSSSPGTDYWPEPYEPPASRAGLAERY